MLAYTAIAFQKLRWSFWVNKMDQNRWFIDYRVFFKLLNENKIDSIQRRVYLKIHFHIFTFSILNQNHQNWYIISFVEYEINLFSFGQIFEYFKAIKNWLWTNKKETDACCMFWIKHFLCQLSLVCCIKLLYSPLSISPGATILRGSNATTSLRPSLMKWTSVPNLNMKMMVRCGCQELCYVQQCSTVQLWSYGSHKQF